MKRFLAILISLSMLIMASCTAERSDVSSAEETSAAVSEATSEGSSEIPSKVSSELPSEITSSVELKTDVHHIFMEEDLVGVIPENLPVYHDGDIKLDQRANGRSFSTLDNRKKRLVYYSVNGYEQDLSWLYKDLYEGYQRYDMYGDLISYIPGYRTWAMNYYQTDDIHDFRFLPDSEEPEEMALVSFIKYYNIPREVMETVLEYIREGIEEAIEEGDLDGYDPKRERYELPNLDIIYTLDNDIINEYYRYA